MLKPVFVGLRYFNNVATAYFVGQVGWKVWKEFRKMQHEKLTAQQLRDRFIEKYKQEHGEPPTEELVKLALDAYNAVERPLKKRIVDAGTAIAKKIGQIKNEIKAAINRNIPKAPVEIVKIIKQVNYFPDLNLCLTNKQISGSQYDALATALDDHDALWTVKSRSAEGLILIHNEIDTPFYVHPLHVKSAE